MSIVVVKDPTAIIRDARPLLMRIAEALDDGGGVAKEDREALDQVLREMDEYCQ